MTHFMRALLLVTIAWVTPMTASAWNTPGAIFGQSKPPWTWTGAALDGDFTNGANWCGSYYGGVCHGQTTAPPSSATLYFDNHCQATSSCNITLPSDQTFAGITLKSNYTGTFDMNGHQLTIGGGGLTIGGGTFTQGAGQLVIGAGVVYAGFPPFTMTGGTFNGGSADIVIGDFGFQTYGGVMMMSGGSFKSTSANLKIHVGTLSMIGLASFAHNGGTVMVEVPSNWLSAYGLGSFTFNNFGIDGWSSKTGSFNNESITVNGNITIENKNSGNMAITDGTFILPNGNLYHVNNKITGNATFKFTGTGVQIVDSTGVASSNNIALPNIWAASTALTGVVRFVGAISMSGFVNNAATNLGSVDLNSQDVRFYGSTYNGVYDSDLTTFPNLIVENSFASAIFGLVKVAGNLEIAAVGGSNNVMTGAGKIQVAGNVINTGGAGGVSTGVTIEMMGTGNQSIDVTGGSSFPNLLINKASGTLSFIGTPNFTGSFALQSGTVTAPSLVKFTRQGGVPVYTFNGLAFNDIELYSGGTYIATYNDDMVINGNLTLNMPAGSLSASPGRKFILSGNLYNSAVGTGGMSGGSPGTVRFVGTNQAVDFSASAAGTCAPALEFAGSGTVTFIGNVCVAGSFNLISGSVALAGTNLTFINSPTITAPGVTFNNVAFSSNNVNIGSGPMVIAGNMAANAAVAGKTLSGSYDVYGNVAFSGNGYSGTATLNLKGNDTTFSNTGAAFPTGLITVAKNAGKKVSLASSLALNANQSVSVTSGQIDIAAPAQALTLTGSGALTLAAGTSVKLSGGTLNIGGSSIPAGSYSGGTIVP